MNNSTEQFTEQQLVEKWKEWKQAVINNQPHPALKEHPVVEAGMLIEVYGSAAEALRQVLDRKPGDWWWDEVRRILQDAVP